MAKRQLIFAFCRGIGVNGFATTQPVHVALWVEDMGRDQSVPTVKQRLAAVRHLFAWLVTGHVMQTNPAHSVRAPTFVPAARRRS